MQGTTGCNNFLGLARSAQQSTLNSHRICTESSKCVPDVTTSTTQRIIRYVPLYDFIVR